MPRFEPDHYRFIQICPLISHFQETGLVDLSKRITNTRTRIRFHFSTPNRPLLSISIIRIVLTLRPFTPKASIFLKVWTLQEASVLVARTWSLPAFSKLSTVPLVKLSVFYQGMELDNMEEARYDRASLPSATTLNSSQRLVSISTIPYARTLSPTE